MKRAWMRSTILVISALFVWEAFRLGFLNPANLAAAGHRLSIFMGDLFPPDFSDMPLLLSALGETIAIAFTGTIAGFLVSLPVAFLASRSLFGPISAEFFRAVVGAVRSVPSILFGVIFVVAFGLGPAAGVAGVTLYTIGYLAKFFYETFEAVDPEVVQALQSTGAGRLALWRHAVLPESSNQVLSQLLFMFEYNIRASTIMGFVGAGGIGYYMLGYVQMLQYRPLLTAILLTFVAVMVVDALSFRVRSAVVPMDLHK